MRPGHNFTELLAAGKRAAAAWWRGIGCRVAFLMSVAIVLVASVLGIAYLGEVRRSADADLQERALSLGSALSILVTEELLQHDEAGLSRTLRAVMLDDRPLSRDLLFVQVFDRAGRLLAGTSEPRTRAAEAAGRGETGPPRDAPSPVAGTAILQLDGRVELTLPLLAGGAEAGSLRIGISDAHSREQVGAATRKAVVILLVMLLLGILFSQVIATGIVRPITRLGAAVEELGRQNWKTPIPVRGRDEFARLAEAFNQMAETLKQRETSLSQGNRDLFILHTAGLDLMESLDLQELFGKISARVEDLIRAETVLVAAVDPQSRALRYLHTAGSRVKALGAQELPFEAGGVYNWLASYGTPLLVQDALSDFRLDAERMRTLGIRSLIAVPLWSSHSLSAVLTVVNKKGGDPFDRHDLRLLTVFSSLAASALQNANLYGERKHSIDELKRTQQQLVHSTKMAAIGELAANLAHEINNPLTSVLGYTSHLIRTLDLPEQSLSKLRLMEQETLRVRKIIRNLLDFSRNRTATMQAGDLAQPLRETVALLHGVAERSSVRIAEDYPGEPVMVMMDHNELKQVFLNIMNNALHAMPEGGVVTVRLRSGAGGEAVVEVQDTGFGIPPENLEKVFEPFFTTKNTGDGTGLGLSISNRIILNHGGRIDVVSEPGAGALFRVILPLTADAPARPVTREV